jgi:phosphoadenosine phosphosulfate reductase
MKQEGERRLATRTVNPEALGRLEEKDEAGLLLWAQQTYGERVAFASSFGAEDVVVIDLIARFAPGIRIFTLDTGRLHEEIYETMEAVRRKYGLTIETYFPDRQKVENLERGKGFFSFRQCIENRKECCLHVQR